MKRDSTLNEKTRLLLFISSWPNGQSTASEMRPMWFRNPQAGNMVQQVKAFATQAW